MWKDRKFVDPPRVWPFGDSLAGRPKSRGGGIKNYKEMGLQLREP